MANEPADAVVRLLQEIRAIQQVQDEALGTISGSLARLDQRFKELDEALVRSAGMTCLEMRQ